MGFSRKRGRPKTVRDKNDYGTFELRQKRMLGLTTEPLDLCLKKKLINIDEHEAGIRLRWLYTLRFGSPGISAYQPEPAGASCFRTDDTEWQHARYLEYDKALKALEKVGGKRIIMNTCIFNQFPSFLLPYGDCTSPYEMRKRREKFDKFRDGMEVLSELLGKRG